MSRWIQKPIFLIPLGMLLVTGAVAGIWLWKDNDSQDGGEIIIPEVAGIPGLQIDRLPGYNLSREGGHDFDVYYLNTEDGSAGLAAYVGRHPNSFRPQTGCTEKPGKLCAGMVKWYVWQTQIDGNTVFKREAYHRLGKQWAGIIVHASIACNDQAHMATLQQAADNIRIVPKPKTTQPTQGADACTTDPTTQPE